MSQYENIDLEDFTPCQNQEDGNAKSSIHTFSKRSSQGIWQKIFQDSKSLSYFVLLSCLLIFCTLGPYLSSKEYDDIYLMQSNQPPSWQVYFGSDELGRDLFVRVLYGMRISFSVAFIAAFLDLLLGVFWGLCMSFFPSWLEDTFTQAAHILYAIPQMILIILLALIFGSGLLSMIAAIAISSWIPMLRMIQAQIKEIKQKDFFLAGQILGFSKWQITKNILLPHLTTSMIIGMSLSIPQAIFMEAFLSFLGLGIQAPHASLGSLSYEGLSALKYYPWRLFFPSLSISFMILLLHLWGQRIQIILNPKLKKTEQHRKLYSMD